MKTTRWLPGDWVIYRKPKRSTAPGRRARNVMPSEKGDQYSYTVDKFWIVKEVLDDGKLLLKTRRGKEHTVSLDDPSLHRPNFIERWLYRRRFEAVTTGASESLKNEVSGM